MTGRWPANVILSPGMAEVLDEQSGITKSTAHDRGLRTAGQHGGALGAPNPLKDGTGGTRGIADQGGASRFFLNAGYEPWELEWILANGLRPCGE